MGLSLVRQRVRALHQRPSVVHLGRASGGERDDGKGRSPPAGEAPSASPGRPLRRRLYRARGPLPYRIGNPLQGQGADPSRQGELTGLPGFAGSRPE